jgi:hypothetical protein
MSMQNFSGAVCLCILSFLYLIHITSCGTVSTVKSVLPGTKEENPGPAAGEKLHLKVVPEEAIAILDEVAPQNGWTVLSVGDQYDLQGLRGKYFRLGTDRFIGGKKYVSGVFFSEPTGSYVIVGKSDTGLPQELAAPFVAAVETHSRTTEEP